MKTSHNNHRKPIGFKVTDNKLMILENQKEIIPVTSNDEAIFSIAFFIHELMLKRSNMFINTEPFFDIEGNQISEKLNKIYIRYYEKF